MFRKEIGARPLLIWLLCAMSAPVAQEVAGIDPLLAGSAAIVCAAVSCLALAGGRQYGKAFAALQYAWTVVAAGILAQLAGKAWPMGAGQQIVPLVLLAIAAWSAGKGPVTAARTAGILLVLLCVGYGLIFTAGLAQVRWDWLENNRSGDLWRMMFLLLIPGVAACLPREGLGRSGAILFVIPVFTVLAAVVTCGNLHPDGVTESFALFEMCRSLSLFGIAERFEALVCALVSVGWFSLLSLLLSCAGANAQILYPGKGKQGTWLAAAAAAGLVLGKIAISDALLLGFGGIFWGFIPILAQSVERLKKCRKK